MKTPRRKPLSREQAAFLRERLARAAKRDPRWMALRDRLLALGGLEVVVGLDDYFDPALPSVLSPRARVFDGEGAMVVRGEGGACHHNVAALCAGEELWRFLHRRDLPKAKIVTGWALSEDGLWRNHSWGVTKDGTVVETTIPRIVYYGVALTPAESLRFVEATGIEARRSR